MRLLALVVACWLPGVISQAAGEAGLIGYGIPEYHPVCCWSCWDVLLTPYLSCTTFMEMDMKLRPRAMMMMGSTSDECRLSNEPYMQSLAYCIKSECDKRDVSHDDQNRCFHRVLPHASHNISYEDTIPQQVPHAMLAEDAEWLNETMLVNDRTLFIAYTTMKGYSRTGYAHSRYS